MRSARDVRALLALQAAYFLATGIWPLVHRPSFEAVTGPKTDFWLVRTVGGLTTLLGGVLGVAALRGEGVVEARALALGSVPVYAAADVYAARRVSRVYLADLVVQAALVGAWSRTRRRRLALARRGESDELGR